MFYKFRRSPLGDLKLVGSDAGLAAILWENDICLRPRLPAATHDERHPVLLETERQLGEYFAGEREGFSIPLDFRGTEFQKKVWAALLNIPLGETRSYLQIASQMGNPKAVRAVGAANSKNPVCIVAPCHRVIGATGKLVGFTGGLAAKEHLLTLERRKAL